MDLKDKVAVVTGGSVGYGKGIAEVLKKNGCRVWVLSSNEEKLKKAAEELGVNYAVCDITNPKDWDAAIKNIKEKDNTIDVLINNAGAGIARKYLVDQTDEEIFRSIMINLVGHIYGIKRVAALMRPKKEGIIINISSIAVDHAWTGWSIYSAAKSGLEMLARCLHNEFRNDNIHIVTLSPSWGATEFLKEANLADWAEEIAAKIMQPVEMGDLVVKVCTLPDHLAITRLRVQPMIQEIDPM